MVLRSAPKSDIIDQFINESVCFTVVVFAAYNLPVTKANIHLCPKPSIRKSYGPQTISAHSCCFRAGKIQPHVLSGHWRDVTTSRRLASITDNATGLSWNAVRASALR